jgi:hypothetical protein
MTFYIHPRLNKIDKFTTQELVDELCKREDVNYLRSTEYHWYKVFIEHEDDYHSINGSGDAHILVVKQP